MDPLSIPIPVRKATIPDMWDQYLLYGLQQSKRSRSDVISSSSSSEGRLSFLSMCLTVEERQENHYMVVQDNSNRFNNSSYRSPKYARKGRFLICRG